MLGPIAVYTTLTIPSVMLLEAFELSGAGHSAAGDLMGSSNQLRCGDHGGISVAADLPGLRTDAHALLLNFLGDGLRDALDVRGSKLNRGPTLVDNLSVNFVTRNGTNKAVDNVSFSVERTNHRDHRRRLG